MSWEPIVKTTGTAVANLVDYDSARSTFSWDRVRAELDGLPGGRGLNIAHEAVDRHALGPRGDRVALRCLGRKEGDDRVQTPTCAGRPTGSRTCRRLGVGPQGGCSPCSGGARARAAGTLKNTSVLARCSRRSARAGSGTATAGRRPGRVTTAEQQAPGI
jgi:acetyl-CoA synthetase